MRRSSCTQLDTVCQVAINHVPDEAARLRDLIEPIVAASGIQRPIGMRFAKVHRRVLSSLLSGDQWTQGHASGEDDVYLVAVSGSCRAEECQKSVSQTLLVTVDVRQSRVERVLVHPKELGFNLEDVATVQDL